MGAAKLTSSVEETAVATPIEFREHIVDLARGWIGTPYHHQAALKGVGCDCFGLVRGVWKELYGSEPEKPPNYSWDWAEARGVEEMVDAAARHMIALPLCEAGAGDVMIFRYKQQFVAKHSVILTGADRMIHAINGSSVSEVHMGPWWRRRAAAAFRFPFASGGVAEVSS